MSDASHEAAVLASAQQLKAPYARPGVPLVRYLHEADTLYSWVQEDREALLAKNFDWSYVDELPARIAICRSASADWVTSRFSKDDTRKEWDERSPAAYELRDELLDTMRYAFRADPALKARIAEIAAGTGHADMIQDLSNLATLALKNSAPLIALNFDMELVTRAQTLANEMGRLLADATSDRATPSDKKLLRDQTLAHLKKAVDEIREAGDFVMRKNPERQKGYQSGYWKNTHTKKPPTDPTAT